MKKRIAALVTAGVLALSMLTGCGSKQESWKVTCPWAPSGVAAMVSQKAAAKSPDYSDNKITLVAEAVKGDAATVNTWVSSTKANDKELVFAGEGLFAITETLDPAKLQFSYDDFEFVENLYSSVFVLSADSSLNLKNLDDLEAYVKAGNPVSVAVNGATGSGKSSLINLVPRFYDTSQGQVLVDGVDVRDYDLKALRDKIGYVPQQSVLFKGTVASNVSYGDQPGDPAEVEMADTSTPAGRKREAALIAAGKAAEGADIPAEQLNRVKAAADVAQASEFVARMDGGYSAAIAQGGSNVSGGQKQRLSIARAVYRHPEILIFDDSFSALDFKTDREVRDALAREAKDSTKLIVAQRIGTIMNADRIVVLDDGKVVGQGTHKELLDNCDVYRQIAESQLSQSELTA